MPSAQQRALTTHRRRRREGGMVRVEVQVPSIDAPMLREIAAVLRSFSQDADAIRSELRLAVTRMRAASVFDIFGSELPDTYFEGVFDHDRARDVGRDVAL